MLSKKRLLELSRCGFIPGPDENEEDFVKRVDKLLNHRCQAEWLSTSSLTQSLFQFTIDWVEVTYTNEKLHFWEGAVTWVEAGVPRIQLKNKTNQRLYSVEEILAHESVHVARMEFNEPCFEEMLAYSTSKSKLRQMLGPFFRSSWESSSFLFLLLLSLIAQTSSFWFGNLKILHLFTLLPWIALVYGAMRLLWNKRCFTKCKRKLEGLFPGKGLSIMLRLTDREIRYFSKQDTEKILVYALSKTTLRWRELLLFAQMDRTDFE